MGRDGNSVNDCHCTIPEGGFCERHKVLKVAHWVKLCQTDPAYFHAWEEGRGPGQRTSTEKLPAWPSLAQEAWNLSKAVLAFIKRPGFVDAQTYHTRLGICQECSYRVEWRCSHPDCGCFLDIKATARAWACPIGKWKALEKQTKKCCGH